MSTNPSVGFGGEQADIIGVTRSQGGLRGEAITLPLHTERASSSLHLSQLTNKNHLQPETSVNCSLEIQPHSASFHPLPPIQQDLTRTSTSRPTQTSVIQGLEPEVVRVGSKKCTSIQSYIEQLEQNISIRQFTYEAHKVRIRWDDLCSTHNTLYNVGLTTKMVDQNYEVCILAGLGDPSRVWVCLLVLKGLAKQLAWQL